MKRIYVLAAGMLLAGTVQSLAQGNFSSNVTTGDWGVAGSWTLTGGTDADGVPDADDVVNILDGHTITIKDDAFCTSLEIGAGTSGSLVIGDDAADDFTVSGSITVNAGGTIQAGSTGIFSLGGNLTNNGTFDLNTGASSRMTTIFNGTSNQTVSGTGTTTEFYLVTINNSGAANDNIVEWATTNTVSVQSAGFLTLTTGIFKLSASTTSSSFFAISNYSIPAGAGFWLNKTGVIVNGKGGTATLGGLLRVTAGTYRVGTGANNSLEYTGSAAQVILEGGVIDVLGRFCRDANAASIISYNESGGVFSVGFSGSTSTTRALFEIANAGSSFTHSSGGISVVRANSSYAYDYFNEAGTYSVTSGVSVQLGTSSTPVSQIIRLYSTAPISHLSLTSTNTMTAELLSDITLNSGVTINANNTLKTNNYNILMKRHWLNNGTFNGGTSTVTLNGTSNQIFFAGNATSFQNLVVNNTSTTGVELRSNVTITGNLTLTDGYVSFTGAGTLTLNDNATVTGASDISFISGPIRKVGDDAFTFPVGKSTGGLYQPITISAPANVTDDFTAEYMRTSGAALDADKTLPLLNVSNCDYWTLTKNSAAAASVDVTLSWSASSNCSSGSFITDPSSLTVAHYNGTEWEEAGSSGSFSGTSTAGTVTRTGVSSFSPFALGNTSIGANPLPVKFGTLRASEASKGILLEWNTMAEEGISHYELQRAADGQNFTTITTIAAKNVRTGTTYSTLDEMPYSGVNFYRIRMVDVIGSSDYSSTVQIKRAVRSDDMLIYPNPVKDKQLNLRGPELAAGVYIVKIYDCFGRQLSEQNLQQEAGQLHQQIWLTASIKPGTYFLQLNNGATSIAKKMFIVE